MAQPVWVLSVDLQTKTATFQTGMADAAKSAKGAFADIKDGAGKMGRETGVSMMEARHGVKMLAEEFGIHIPRALASFVASIGPIGAAMEAAFPFLAIIALAGLLMEHLKKLKEEGRQLAENEEKFITVTSNVFANLDQKMLQAGIRADELDQNHLAALKKQLQLIDRASLNELVKSFEEVAKAADAVFGPLQAHWYNFGTGSRGAQHALQQFKTEYEKLIAQGKDKEASDLLHGTLGSAERILEMQRQYNASQTQMGPHADNSHADYAKWQQANNELKKAGVQATDKEIEAQQTLIETLKAQVDVEGRIASLKKLEKDNASRTTGKTLDSEGDAAFKRGADAEAKENEIAEKLREEAYSRALNQLQQSQREKIEATERGSAERLAVIDAAIKEEESKGLQETGFYRQLLTSKIETARQMSEEQRRVTEEAGREEAQHTLRMGELRLEAEREQRSLLLSGRRVTAQRIIAEELQSAKEEYQLRKTALDQQIAALDKNGKDYQNKLRTLQNRELELTRAHENQVTALKDKAEKDRLKKMMDAAEWAQEEVSRGLAGVVMRHQSFASMIGSIGDQVAGSMIQNAIKSMVALDMTKPKEAAAAARKAFLAGWHFPFPANIVMAPALGALAFASVMAFNKGGEVPGSGNSDTVPAMLTPGEHVADQALTEGLRGMVKDHNAQPSSTYKLQAHYAPTIQALDSVGVDQVLEKHEASFQRKFEQVLRKMNR